MENNLPTPSTTVGIGKKTLVFWKGGVWLALALLLVISAAPTPTAQASHPAPLIAGDEPKIGTGG
ncbi:MAG TPA: hypothetical protein VFS50_17965 [Meiothermus sp.]|nr:hypothetical protein [Meiothermus sp.]